MFENKVVEDDLQINILDEHVEKVEE